MNNAPVPDKLHFCRAWLPFFLKQALTFSDKNLLLLKCYIIPKRLSAISFRAAATRRKGWGSARKWAGANMLFWNSSNRLQLTSHQCRKHWHETDRTAMNIRPLWSQQQETLFELQCQEIKTLTRIEPLGENDLRSPTRTRSLKNIFFSAGRDAGIQST